MKIRIRNHLWLMSVCLTGVSVMTGCSSEDGVSDVRPPVPVVHGTAILVTAGDSPSEGTRVSYAENGTGTKVDASWEDGKDQLMVLYDGLASELPMTELDAESGLASFSGTLKWTDNAPAAESELQCIVSNDNIEVNAGSDKAPYYSYKDGAITSQDGTLPSASALNILSCSAKYGTGSDIHCDFSYNACIVKFNITAPTGTATGTPFTLTYYCEGSDYAGNGVGTIEISGTTEETITPVYFGIPAGSYTDQRLVLTINDTPVTFYLSSKNTGTFKSGLFYRRNVSYENPELTVDGTLVAWEEGDGSWDGSSGSGSADGWDDKEGNPWKSEDTTAGGHANGWDTGENPWGSGTVISTSIGGWLSGSTSWNGSGSEATTDGWEDEDGNPWKSDDTSGGGTINGYGSGESDMDGSSSDGSVDGWKDNGDNPTGNGSSSNAATDGWEDKEGNPWKSDDTSGSGTVNGWDNGGSPMDDSSTSTSVGGWTNKGNNPWGE